jgi:alkyldihydroxyacetonephosphate synthase
MSAPNGSGAATQEDHYQKVKWNGWGDKGKVMRVDEADPFVVIHPSGKPMRALHQFIHQEINGGDGPVQKLERSPSIPVEEAMERLPAPIVNQGFMAQLGGGLSANQIKSDPESRLTHVVGKNYRDLWRIRKGIIVRAPDAVVLPESHDDCVKLMDAATKHNVVLIPYGGGTNVTGCIEPSPFETKRMIVSIDMRRMTKMMAIDKESRTATFECGVLGPDLDEQLGRCGFMLGHDPDSYVFSTLGGWIASRSSGAFSNKYGDIEQMVLSLKVVTPKGVVETPTVPRPVGPDLNAVFIGSEGTLGIITEATIKIELQPEARHYEGWLFPNFETGYAAFYKATAAGVSPTAMRLYDEDDTRMSFALKTDAPMVQNLVSKGIKQYLQHGKGFDMAKISLCIVGFEGSAAEVAHQKALIKQLYNAHNAFCVGTGAGDNWSMKKYDLPYVRDFALSHCFWADVFETVVVYGEALSLWRAVKDAVRAVWKAEGKKGWIGCHTAHQYKHGTCLYFTYAGQQFDDNDMLTFLKIKKAATEQMLKHKGALTHHHGVGYEHVPWMPKYLGAGTLDMLLRMKQDVDPQDICNPHKLLPVPRKAKESQEAWEERRAKLQMFDGAGLPQAKL